MVLAILGAISEGIGFVVACVYTQAIYVVSICDFIIGNTL